ncbi:MAG: DUF4430 domain-containing protein [Lachnospiraceae bacterium]
MQMKHRKKTMSFILCVVLIVAMALSTTGCNGNPKNKSSQNGSQESTTSDVTVLGEGSTSFAFTVVDLEGNTTAFEIHTDKDTVGSALLELGLIDGDDSEYGLFVKTVNNITVDYDKDGKYWAFYVDGEYATSGVDTTPITAGSNYSFQVE